GDCSMTQWGGTFSTGATCPSASRVGTCVISTQLPGVTYKWSFYSPTYTAQTGQTFCTNFSGFWTPGEAASVGQRFVENRKTRRQASGGHHRYWSGDTRGRADSKEQARLDHRLSALVR